jgi:hypothetical protein
LAQAVPRQTAFHAAGFTSFLEAGLATFARRLFDIIAK